MKDSIRNFYDHLPEDMDPYLQKQWGNYFLRRDASLCGLGALLILAVQLICSPILDGILAALKLSGGYSEATKELLNALLYIAYMGIPFLIIALVSRRKAANLIQAEKARPGTMLPALLIGLGSMPVLQYASAGFDWLLSLVALDTYQPILDQAFSPVSTPAAVAVQFFQTAVLAAFFEEFAYRGVILQLLRRYGDKFAVIASAFLFSLMHGNTYQMPYTFMLGLVIGAAVVWTGSIWTGVALHFGNNFVAFAITLITDNMDERQGNGIALAVWGVVFAAGLVGLIIAARAKERGKLPPLAATPPEMPVDRPFRTFFSAPWVIAATVLFGLEALILTTLVQHIPFR